MISKSRQRIIALVVVCLIASGLLAVASCNRSNPVDIAPVRQLPPPFNWNTSTPQAQGVDPNLIAQANTEFFNKGYVESFLVVRNGFLIEEDYYTLAGKYTSGGLASVTKSFTSALVGIAIREHHLDSLGQCPFDFFPEYVQPSLDPRKRSMTLRHLLTMTSGFDDTESADHSGIFNQNTNWMQNIITMALRNNPGEVFNYTSVNAHLMSGVLTKATGMSTADFAQQYLFTPLKITLVAWPRDPQNYNIGGSGIEVYSRDLARFGYLYVREGTLDSESIIPADWARTSTQPHDGVLGSWGAFTNVSYGYFWWTATWNSDSVFLAVGYGGQLVIGDPRVDCVIVVTSNLNCTQAEADQRHLDILDILARDVLSGVH